MNKQPFESISNLSVSMTPAQKNAFYRTRAKEIRHAHGGELLPVGLVCVLLGAVAGMGLDLAAGGLFGYLAAAIGLTTSVGRAFLLISVIVLGVLGGICVLGTVFLSSPLRLGMQRLSLDLIDGADADMGTLFTYFRAGYFKSVRLNLLYSLTVMLPCVAVGAAALIPAWIFRADLLSLAEGGTTYTLVAVGVGVAVAAALALTCFLTYSYRFAFTVMAEHPHMTAIEAMRVSRTMMSGHRYRLFLFDLHYVGWSLLATLTLGISHIFVTPTREIALAAFYDELTNRSSAKEVMFPSLNFDDYVTEEEQEKTEAKPTPVREKTPDVPTDEQGTGGMPFTSELFFPSLDPADYAGDDDDGLFHRKRVKRDKNDNN